MSLRGAPLLYVFYETAQLDRQRELFESVIGVPVVEVEPHLPHERHGVFKYDAGGILLSHNLSGPTRFREGESDGLVTVFRVPPGWPLDRLRATGTLRERDGLFTDPEGRHFRFVPGAAPRPVVRELTLTVDDLDASVAFYRDTLGLELAERTGERARFATGSVDLALARSDTAPDGGRPRHHSYLLVFHAARIEALHAELVERGVEFQGAGVGYSEIGGTVRFDDPSGQRICLYEPSEESLTWGSGPKVIEIAGLRGEPAAV